VYKRQLLMGTVFAVEFLCLFLALDDFEAIHRDKHDVTPVSVRQRFNSSRRQAKKRKRRGFLAPPAIAATPSLGLLDA